MSVPELAVVLAAAGIIATKTARIHLDTLRDRTNDTLIDAALRILRELEQERRG